MQKKEEYSMYSKPTTAQRAEILTQALPYIQKYYDKIVVVKYGVSINAVAESLKEGIKYKVEYFTGMIVDTVNVNVIGVKL